MLIKILSSKNTTLILLLGWISSIVYAYYFISPRDDDGIYLLPALSVYNGYPPGYFVDNTFIPVFFIFPLQSFLNGLFLSILDPNFYNYKLFNLILIFPLLIFTIMFNKQILNKVNDTNLSQNLFLILLAITPFSTNFYINRPDILGLLFFFFGLFVFYKCLNNNNFEKNYFFLSFISLGLSAISHPNFIILLIPILPYLLFILFNLNFSFSKLFFLIFTFFFPLFIFVLWFFLNLDTSIPQLFNRANEIKPEQSTSFLKGLILIFSNSLFLSNETNLQKFYNSFFIISSSAALVFLAYSLLNFKKVFSSSTDKIIALLSIASFFLLLLMPSYPPTLLIFSFCMMVFLNFFLVKLISKKKFILKENISTTIISFLFAILFLCSPIIPIITHVLKVKITTNNYYDIQKTNYVISPLLKKNKLIITTPQLLPPFTSHINLNIKEKKVDSFFWLFPGGQFQEPHTELKVLYQKQLNRVVEMNLDNKSLWGVSKRQLIYLKSGDVCIKLRGNFSTIRLQNPKKIFEDRDNVFFKPITFKSYTNIYECKFKLNDF